MLVDSEGHYLEVNPAAAELLGLDRATLRSFSLPEPWSNLSAADGSALAAEDFPGLTALRNGTPVRRKTLGWGREDGSTLWLEVSAEPLQGGGALVSFDDITAHRVQSRKVERLTELYSALSHVNQAIVWSPTKEALLDKICEVMVEFGKFSMAWIGWNDPATHEVRVLSKYGDKYGYLDNLQVRSDDTPMGQGGTGTAIREERTCVVNDFLGSPKASPWLEAARRSGFAASAAAPSGKMAKPVVP
jgi:PAS domain S-box-containing protein